MPAFYLGILLILLLAIRLKWLPAIGGGNRETSGDLLALSRAAGADAGPGHDGVGGAAGALGDAQRPGPGLRADGPRQGAARAARSCCATPCARPWLPDRVASPAIWAVSLIGDSVTVEVVFARPGLGKMMVGAMLQRDYTALQSVMVVYTGFVVGDQPRHRPGVRLGRPADPALTSGVPAAVAAGELRRLWRTFSRNRVAVLGLALVAVVAAARCGAPLLTPPDPYEQRAQDRLQPPDAEPSPGAGHFGRDVLARILFAGRVSLLVGLGSVVLGGVSGCAMGLVAGYAGGRVENVDHARRSTC